MKKVHLERVHLEKVNDMNNYRNTNPHKLLIGNLRDLRKGRRINSEIVKIFLNTTRFCTLELHCMYYSKKDKKLDEYLLIFNTLESGNAAREFLEDMIEGQLKYRFGKQAADDYAKSFMGYAPLIKWVRQKNDLVGISMSHASENMQAGYVAFVKKISGK